MSDDALVAIVIVMFFFLIFVGTWITCTLCDRRNDRKRWLEIRKRSTYVPSYIPDKQVNKYINAKIKQEDNAVCHE